MVHTVLYILLFTYSRQLNWKKKNTKSEHRCLNSILNNERNFIGIKINDLILELPPSLKNFCSSVHRWKNLETHLFLKLEKNSDLKIGQTRRKIFSIFHWNLIQIFFFYKSAFKKKKDQIIHKFFLHVLNIVQSGFHFFLEHFVLFLFDN